MLQTVRHLPAHHNAHEPHLQVRKNYSDQVPPGNLKYHSPDLVSLKNFYESPRSPSASLATSPTTQRAATAPRSPGPTPKGKTIPRPLSRQRTLVDLVQQGVQQEEVSHVRELFAICDKNGDGSIDMVLPLTLCLLHS